MKTVLLMVVLCGMAACGNNGPRQDWRGSDSRQEPSNLTPGVHISGHANFGVKRSF